MSKQIECIAVPKEFLEAPRIKEAWQEFDKQTNWTKQKGVVFSMYKGEEK